MIEIETWLFVALVIVGLVSLLVLFQDRFEFGPEAGEGGIGRRVLRGN